MILDEIDLATEDRLDVVLGAGLLKLDHAVHHAMVGQSERWLTELGGTGGKRLDFACAVEQGVLGVDVQMSAEAVSHRSANRKPRVGGASVAFALFALHAPARDPRQAVLVRRAAPSRLGGARRIVLHASGVLRMGDHL